MENPSMSYEGYTVRFRVRAMKWRKRKNGRARGFYGGVAVYLRVRGPDGVTRDLYLGNDERSASPPKKARGSGKLLQAPATSRPGAPGRGGRKRGQKRSSGADDTRDPYDDRTLSLFERENRWRPEPWARKKK